MVCALQLNHRLARCTAKPSAWARLHVHLLICETFPLERTPDSWPRYVVGRKRTDPSLWTYQLWTETGPYFRTHNTFRSKEKCLAAIADCQAAGRTALPVMEAPGDGLL